MSLDFYLFYYALIYIQCNQFWAQWITKQRYTIYSVCLFVPNFFFFSIQIICWLSMCLIWKKRKKIFAKHIDSIRYYALKLKYYFSFARRKVQNVKLVRAHPKLNVRNVWNANVKFDAQFTNAFYSIFQKFGRL